MLIAAPNSHGINGDSSIDQAVPAQSSSQDPQKVSLFDLLLSQLMAPSYHANSPSPDEKTSTSDLVADTGRIGTTTPHPTRQKSTQAAGSVTTNPLTNLLFLSTGHASQRGTPETTITTGILSNSAKTTKSADDSVPSPLAGPSVRQSNTDSANGRAGQLMADSETAFVAPELTTEDMPHDPAPMDRPLTNGQNRFDTQTPSAIPGGSPLQSGLIQTLNPGQTRSELSLVRPDALVLPASSATAVTAKLNLVRPTVGLAFNMDVQSVHVSTEPAEPAPVHETAPVQRAVVCRNDIVTPSDQTQATLNIMPSAKPESTPAISDLLATAITETLANLSHDGSTTVHIRLDRPDLGKIDLQLSVNKDNVVSVRIQTDNLHSQQIVESQMAALRESLTSNGVTCGQFQVGCDSNSRQSSSQSAPRQTTRPTGVFSASRTSNSERLRFPVSRQNGRVNYVA